MDLQRVNILGVGVSAINMGIALEVIHEWIQRRSPHYVCVTGVHGIMESQRDRNLRIVHNQAGLVTPDGMPLVWLSWLKGFHHVDRVYGPDLMLAVCEQSLRYGYRHFFYGGAAGVPESLAGVLQKRFPGLRVVGTYSPPFRALSAEEDAQVVQMLNEAHPDIIWVGLSTPKQERWMAAHRAQLTAPVLIGVGAAFDFLTGRKPQAPRWMQRAGLEWFFRLLTEPRRLWRRYLINNPLFVAFVVLELLGIRKVE